MNFKNFKISDLFMAVIFIIFGLMITLQVKSIQKQTASNARQQNFEVLQQLLREEKERSKILEERIKKYEEKIKEYETRYVIGNEIEKVKAELDQARFLAGLTDVSGPGVVIKLDDSKKRITEGIDPNDTVIHDSQLLEIINLLKSWGAQAISINDERIVATSETQCAGPTVSVNHTRYAVPFVIKAIGNADYLEAKLKEPGNILDIMSVYGIQISIKKEKEIDIPKYKGLFSNTSNINMER